jgi:WD40 repeat protein
MREPNADLPSTLDARLPERPAPAALAPEERLAVLWQRGQRAAIEQMLAGLAGLPPDQLAQVLLLDQWHRWRAGERMPAEDYLRRHAALAKDDEGALALVYGEFLVREEMGEAPPPDEYVARFPALATRFRQQVELHRALGPSDTMVSGPTEDVPPPAGTIAGYEICGELGRGSMGVVYRAWQIALRRLVALKRVLAADAAPGALARFRTEAEAVARLQHPNIVQVYEFGEEDGQPFFSMELVDGGTLAGLLRDGPMPVREAAELIATLARAIDYAHGRGVVHRDLKPANILIEGVGTAESAIVDAAAASPRLPAPDMRHHGAKITDFGLAKLVAGGAGHTASGTLLGTPAYMAPEQAGEKGEIGPAVDTYALGAILYETLTGRAPFWADSVVDTLVQVRTQEPIPPRRLRPSVPRDLEVICLKCLEKNPAQRYASALELAADLDRFLRHEPIHARPIGRLARLGRWGRRNPALATVGAVALALLIGVAAISASFGVYYAYAAKQLGTALAQSDHLSAGLALDSGLNLCEQRDTGSGLLWLARSLELAAKTDDAALERAIRINLSTWSDRFHPLRACLEHSAPVTAIAFSPDSKRIATAAGDGTVRFWDAATGESAGLSLPHRDAVAALAFSPDGRQVVAGCADGMAYRWDARTGAALPPALGHGTAITHALFDANGRWCITVGGRSVHVWDAATGERKATLSHASAVTAAALGGDGTTLLTGTKDGAGTLWSLPAGNRRELPTAHDSSITAVGLQPAGNLAATADDDGHLRLWDATTGMPERTERRRHGAAIVVCAFSPDGRQLLTASSDWRARVSLVADPKRAPHVLPHLAPISIATFSPDGNTVLTGSLDGRGQLWNAATGEPIANPLLFQAGVRFAAFSPDGRSVALAGDDQAVRVWRMGTAAPAVASFEYPEYIYAAAFSPDGKLLATGGEGDVLCPIRLWEASTGNPRHVLPGHARTVRSLKFSADSSKLASGGGDGIARIWDVATGADLQRTEVVPAWVSAVAFSPDGRVLLTGTKAGTVRLWDLVEHKVRAELPAHAGPVLGAAFSPDGARWLTGSSDLTAHLGDTASSRLACAPLRHQGQVWSVAFSGDGSLALTGSDDRTVRVWDAATGQPSGAALVDAHMARLALFSPDGRMILKGGLRDDSRLWDQATRKPLGPPIAHSGGAIAATFTHDGRRLILAGENLCAAPVPVTLTPMAGTPAQIALQMRLAVGAELDANDGLRFLDAAAWHECRRQLESLP